MQEYIDTQLDEARRIVSDMLNDGNLRENLKSAAQICISCLQTGGKIMLAGNGGSAGSS